MVVECNPGWNCVSPSCASGLRLHCFPGYFCAPNRTISICEKGHFCPLNVHENPQENTCPSRHYCTEGAPERKHCDPLSICPERSTHPIEMDGFVIMGSLVLFTLLIINIAQRQLRKRKRIRREKLADIEEDGRYARMDSDTLVGPLHGAAPDPSELVRSSTIVCKDIEFSVRPSRIDRLRGIRGTGKNILRGITLEFQPGCLHAVMGPSGCGKSTLLHILCGLREPTQGYVTMAGKSVHKNISSLRSDIGFVPQDDCMLETLTVKEVVRHSAFTRLPSLWSADKVNACVDWAIHAMKLDHVRNCKVGGELVRGISGGEKRRASIAVELVAMPSTLFLDEPTSGLDATSSKEVVECMNTIANTGVNVIAVIHQPRHDVFMTFKSVAMLTNTGKVAYHGTPQDALEYFESFGFKCPAITNSADFFLDLLSTHDVPYGVIDEKSEGREHFAEDFPVDPDEDKDESEGEGRNEGNEDDVRIKGSGPLDRVERMTKKWELIQEKLQHEKRRSMIFSEPGDIELAKTDNRKKRGLFVMIFLYMWRSMLVVYHDWFSYVLVCIIHAGAGAVMGIVFFNESIFVLPISPEYALRNLCPDAVKIEFCLLPAHDVVGLFSLFALMGIGVTGVSAGVKTFGDEKTVFFREASRGASASAYVLARMLIDIPWIAVCSLSFVTTFSVIASNQVDFYTLFLLIYLAELCVFGVIYILSLIMTQSNATLFGIVLTLVWSTQNGWATKIQEMGIIGTVSYPRWFGEALFIAEVDPWDMSAESRNIVTYFLDHYVYGYDIHNFSLDVGMLLVHSLFFRLVAAAIMMIKVL
eukprot:TRINITY_DN81068_c0_g1_i1.p1 TRINITY_DN81068_c0_g1~~TRINITY_DN81068_c0_g1_i1.p1  ORF type:complete len:814 (+),score=198.48 TRINITY_DN81068_c0_g1_i1:127-2568(+)